MGGHSKTKKTFEQVKQELYQQLYTSANKLLGTPGAIPANITFEDLSNVVKRVAHEHFRFQYGYEYLGQQSRPPSDDPGNKISSTEGISSYDSVTDGGIAQYIDQRILNVFDEITKDVLRGDLQALCRDLFMKPSDNAWHAQQFAKEYHSPNRADDFSDKVDGLFVFCNARLVADGNEVHLVVIHFVGVFYKVTSPIKAVKDNLMDTLVKNAKTLSAVSTVASSDTESQQLFKLLGDHATSKFSQRNGYVYNGNQTSPLDMFENTQDRVRSADVLCFPADRDLGRISAYVRANVLNAMQLPEWLLDEHSVAQEDLDFQFEHLLSQNTGNDWFTVPFDKVYDNPDTSDLSVRTAVTMIFTNASLTQSNITVSRMYMFYLGIYYRVESPMLAARRTLLMTLVSRAKDLSGLTPSPGKAPSIQLSQLLEGFAREQFRKQYGFIYDTTNSRPGDLVQGRNAQGVAPQFFFDEKVDLTVAVRSKVRISIVRALRIDRWLQEQIQSDVEIYISDMASLAQLNVWNWTPFQAVYINRDHPTSVDPWAVSGLVTYANGSMNDDGNVVKATIIHFLGVFYPTSNATRSMGFRALLKPEGR